MLHYNGNTIRYNIELEDLVHQSVNPSIDQSRWRTHLNLGLTWRKVGNFQKKLLRVHTAFLRSRSHIHALDPQRKDRLQAVYVGNESILHKD